MVFGGGSQTVEASTVSPSRTRTSSSRGLHSGRTAGSTSRSSGRALVSSIDASLALWNEGRRERLVELEGEIRQHDAQQQQQQQQQQRGSTDTVEGLSRRETTQEDVQSRPAPSRSTSATSLRLSAPPLPPPVRPLAPPQATELGSPAGGERRQHSTSSGRGCCGAGSEAEVAPAGESKVAGQGEGADAGAGAETRRVGVRGSATTSAGDAAARRVVRIGARGGGSGHTRVSPSSSTMQLEMRLEQWSAGWRPPELRELPRGGEGFFSGWTHLGQPERFELVKSVNRSVGQSGGPLSDAELEWAVLCLEEAEDLMAALDFSTAAGVLERVLVRCPGLTLAYYRLALCLLAVRGAHASRQATRLLDCAMFLEGDENQHLRACVDLVMRILRNERVPEAYWSEDYPRSLGDLRALEAALDQLL